MSLAQWFQALQGAQKTCMVADGRKKIHFTFLDKSEMVEEYDAKTDDLVVRKWRAKSALGGEGTWTYEVGEEVKRPSALAGEQALVESNLNPVFARKDSKVQFQWRVRNLPYPIDNYSVSVDADRHLTIRTANKKFYKRFNIPDLDRCAIPLDARAVTFAHANNTLIVSYAKPQPFLEFEAVMRAERTKLVPKKEGDVECNPQ